MASTPGYDPNTIPDDIASLNKADPSVLTNRAIQSLYPPGSTFKVVTAAAAIDSGKAHAGRADLSGRVAAGVQRGAARRTTAASNSATSTCGPR